MYPRPGNAFAQRKEMERRQMKELEVQQRASLAAPPPLSIPYPQPTFFGHQQQVQPEQPIWFNPSNPPSDFDSLRDERGRPLTTWSMIDDAIQAQQKSPITLGPQYFPSPGQRSVTDPTNGSHSRQMVLHNTYAGQNSGLRARGRIDWKTFRRGRKHTKISGLEVPVDMIRNANLTNPGLDRNQQFPLRPSSQASEIFMPRRTPPARYAALQNRQIAAMPANLSTATARTNVTAQSQYVQPIRNDALLMGSGPMIPTRDGSYAATGIPRTVQGQPVTSMMGQMGSFSPISSHHSAFPQQSSPLPQILETDASTFPAKTTALSGGVEIHPFLYNSLNITEEEKEEIARSRSADGVAPVRESGKSLILKLESQQTQTPTPVKRSSSHHEFRNAFNLATPAPNTLLSPSAPVFTPGTNTFRMPAYSQQAQFTIEQLITRIDRLQLKQEEDRQLLYQFVTRQTQDRSEIVELKRRLEHRHLERTPLRDFSTGEIGSGWYNQV